MENDKPREAEKQHQKQHKDKPISIIHSDKRY